MDWDWEDGPPRDTPPRTRPSEEPPRERPDADAPDDQATVVILPQAGDEPPASLERPHLRTGEMALRSSVDAAGGRDDVGPRTTTGRTEARAKRRRQLRRRRLTALGVLVAIVVLLVLLIVLLTRGCGASSTANAGTDPSAGTAALRTPTAVDPLRMAAYGESVGGGALLGMKLLTEGRKDIKVHRFVKVATGLTRPDFFDWPAYLKGDIDKRTKPFDAVMLMFGANDGQDTKVDGKQLTFGSGSWKAMYAQRVGAVMDIYLKRGVKRVYWVGMPRMGIGWFNQRMELMNGIYKAEAAKRSPAVEYVDAWSIVDAPATTYQAKYRQADGVHMTVDGGVKVAKAVLAAVAKDWHLPPFKQ